MALAARRERTRTILAEGGSAQTVDEQRFAQLVESGRTVITEHTDGRQGVRLWDNVDQAWTNPLPADKVENYLRQGLVLKCTACKYTSGTTAGVASHVASRLQHARAHQGDVQLTTFNNNGVTGKTCSACGDGFTRPGQAERHVEWWREQGQLHVGATHVLMERFARQQPVAEGIVRRIPAPAGTAETVPEAPHAGEEHRSGRKRRRRRRRSRKGASE